MWPSDTRTPLWYLARKNQKRLRPLSHFRVAALGVQVPTSWKKEGKVMQLNRTYRFTASGNGTGNTSPFAIPTTTRQWQLASSYNCASFGGSGDHSVDIDSRAGNGATDQDFNDNGPDTQGLGGDGVDTFYDTGTFEFQVCAICNWPLRVIK
jgi:hypothetical protein